MFDMTITEQKTLAGFGAGVDCSQAVFAEFAPQLGLERETALKVAAVFGGGMSHGYTCGCVTGALMAIGLRYGQGDRVNMAKKNRMLAIQKRFEEEFAERFGSCICKEMLGYDLSIPEERDKVMEEHLFSKLCAKAVVGACEILQEIFEDEPVD